MNTQGAVIRAPDFPSQRTLFTRPYKLSELIFSEGIDEQLRKEGWTGPPKSLDTSFPNSTFLYVVFCRCSRNTESDLSPRAVESTLDDIFPFTHRNQHLVDQLDKVIFDHFSIKIKAKNGTSKLIYNAVLAGSYLRAMCTTVFLGVPLRMSLDDVHLENENAQSELKIHVKHFFFHRLGDLVTEILASVRPGTSSKTGACSSSITHAAAGILQAEAQHAKEGIKMGAFAEQVISDVSRFHCRTRAHTELLQNHQMPNGPLIDWLTKVGSELRDYLTRGCREYPNWRDVLDGSVKQLHRPGPAEGILIVTHLFQARLIQEHQNESRIPPRPSPRTREPISPMRRLVSRRSSNSDQSTYPNPPSYLTPTSTGRNTPSCNGNYSSELHQMNQLVSSDATYNSNSQAVLRPWGSLHYSPPSAMPASVWTPTTIETQLPPNFTLSHDISRAFHPRHNPFHMYNFQGQDRTQWETVSEFQIPLHPTQSPADTQGGIFDDSAFPFVNQGNHEIAEDNAFMDDPFQFKSDVA